jgi:hypothetical protein
MMGNGRGPMMEGRQKQANAAKMSHHHQKQQHQRWTMQQDKDRNIHRHMRGFPVFVNYCINQP